MQAGRKDLPVKPINVDVRVNPFFATKRLFAFYGPKVLPPASLGVLFIEFIRRRVRRI
jgi:hypothetical protein